MVDCQSDAHQATLWQYTVSFSVLEGTVKPFQVAPVKLVDYREDYLLKAKTVPQVRNGFCFEILFLNYN